MNDLEQFNPPAGKAEMLGANVQRILANNPSPMTFRGTNTYLIGSKGLGLIDPGPDDTAHLNAILAALGPNQHISHIFVTHSHVDHSPLAGRLSQITGAKIYAFGDSQSGRSPVMRALAASGLSGGGEGVDHGFAPDICLQDKDRVQGDGWALTALHTPGHFGNHMCFALDDTLFCGDLVMGWASSLVSPPDGDLTAFMASCARLQRQSWQVFHAGHGAPIEQPNARLKWLIAHRKTREADILATLAKGPASARQLAKEIYTETPTALLAAAERNVFAHLVDLTQKEQIRPMPQLAQDALFQLCEEQKVFGQ